MGTLQNGLESVFRAIAEAATPHRNVQLVLSIGGHLDLDQIGPLPSNAVVVRHAPQLELLKRASVCITHAGLNTVLEALAHGVPQVTIPITVDQPGVAARIAEKKTGLVVSLKELTPSRLSLLLDQVLNDSTYRDEARHFQEVIAETNGLSKAANLLEQAFGFGNHGQPLLEAQQEARKQIWRDWQIITCLQSGSGRCAKDPPADIAMSQAPLPEIPAQFEAD